MKHGIEQGMNKQPPKQITLTERFSTAYASAYFSGLLLVVPPFILAIITLLAKGAFFYLYDYFAKYYSVVVFSKIGAGIIIVSSIMGFCLGVDRMTAVYGFLMGNNWASKIVKDRPVNGMVLIFLIAIMYVAMIVIFIYQFKNFQPS